MRTRDGSSGKKTAAASANDRAKAKAPRKKIDPSGALERKKKPVPTKAPPIPNWMKNAAVSGMKGIEAMNKSLDTIPGVKELKKATRKRK